MATRSDRICEILQTRGGRLPVGEIAEQLAQREELSSLNSSTVSATVSQENKGRDLAGRTPRFNTYGDGNEEWGYISIRQIPPPPKNADFSKFHDQIPQIVESSNNLTRNRLKEAIAKLSWQDFESNFLVRVLEALGFHAVELTQPTKDGGKDALCKYRVGKALAGKQSRPRGGAERLRGIKGNADTGIIATSSQFTNEAQKEAEPSQNQRAIVLIDGDLIVETCITHSIGIRPVNLPTFYEFTGFEDASRGPEA